MSNKELLKVGDRIDVFLGKGPYYRTMLEDITEDRRLVISTPIYRGIPIILHKDQEVELNFYRPNGRFWVMARVTGFRESEFIRFVELDVLTAPHKQQRRGSFRVDVTLEAIVRKAGAGPFLKRPSKDDAKLNEERVLTINLSETGCAFRTTSQYVEGSRIYIRIFLKWPEEYSPPLEFISEIRQSDMIDSVTKTKKVGVQFIDLTDDVAAHISKFVFLEQQKSLKRIKLDEEYGEEI